MRTFVISDIHGNNSLFKTALKKIEFKKSDSLIILGDLIDRGADSKGVLDTVFLLLENKYNVECLMGNHEFMFLNALSDVNILNQWLINGGDKTMLSFLTSSINRIPKKYFELVSTFKYYKEFENFILVHASINMKIENPYSDINTMLWDREPKRIFDSNWLKSRKIIHGHSPKSQKEILKSIIENEQIICIDNGTFLKKENFGTLCILQLENLKPIFINENY